NIPSEAREPYHFGERRHTVLAIVRLRITTGAKPTIVKPNRVHPCSRDMRKIEGPQILSNLRAASDAGPVSRILCGVAAAMVIPLGRPLLNGSSDLPESLAPRAETHSGYCYPEFLSYLVLLRVGFALPRPLLAGRCALTAPFHPYPGKPGRYVFCGTFR